MSAILIPTGNAGKLREFLHAFAKENRVCLGLKDASELLGTQYAWQTPVEDRQTFAGNGYRKLTAAIPLLEKLRPHGATSVLVDDSGLCIPRLNYLPGVNSATLAGEPRDDARNRKYLIELLKSRLNITAENKEPGFFVCSLLIATHVGPCAEGDGENSFEEDELLIHLESLEQQILEKLHSRITAVETAAYAYECTMMLLGTSYRIQLVMGFCNGFVATFEQELLAGEGHGYDAMFFPQRCPQLSFASIPLEEKNRMSHRSEALRGLSEWAKSHNAQGGIRELF
ncbi:MAG: hypothetical protein RLZZ488_490 [Pseudomonadota bacterium]